MQRFVGPAPAENPFVATFVQKMTAMQALGDEKRAQLRTQAEEIVRMDIYPAWQRAIALLEAQLPRATDDAGLWRLKDGAAAYAYFLRRYTTTNLTPDQIHDVRPTLRG